MQQSRRMTAIIEHEGDGYEALCGTRCGQPERQLEITHRRSTVPSRRRAQNLIEALTLLFEAADASEIEQRFHSDLFVTQVEVPVG